MNHKKDSDKLKSLFPQQDFELSNADYDQLERQFLLLDRLAEVENSSVSVLDLYKGKFIYLRSKYIDKMGYDLNKALTQGPSYFYSLIHTDDLTLILDTNKRIYNFIQSLPIDEKKDYKVIQNYRVRNAQNKYIPFIMQVIPLELDKKGNIWLILMLDDLLPDKTKFDKVNRSLVNIRNGKKYLFNCDISDEKSSLSTREIEILGLAAKGYASKEIADQLFISVNTVNNHRQKILEKTNAANTSEAVNYARTLGLL